LVAGKYLGLGRISSEQYDQLVEDLANLPIDRIDAFAEITLGKAQRKTASEPASVLTAAVVVEPKEMVAPEEAKSYASKLADLFTVGNSALSADQHKQ